MWLRSSPSEIGASEKTQAAKYINGNLQRDILICRTLSNALYSYGRITFNPERTTNCDDSSSFENETSCGTYSSVLAYKHDGYYFSSSSSDFCNVDGSNQSNSKPQQSVLQNILYPNTVPSFESWTEKLNLYSQDRFLHHGRKRDLFTKIFCLYPPSKIRSRKNVVRRYFSETAFLNGLKRTRDSNIAVFLCRVDF